MKVIEILDRFPKISETFILREILAIQKKGIDIEVFAFEKYFENVVHPQVNEVKKVTYFLKTCGWQKVYAHFYWIFHAPFAYTKTAIFAANHGHGLRNVFFNYL